MSNEPNSPTTATGATPAEFRFLRVRWFGQVKVLDVARTVDTINIGGLQEELRHAIDEGTPPGVLVLINFRMVGFLQSVAARRVVETLIDAAAQGRSVSVCHPTDSLGTLLTSSEFRGSIRLWNNMKDAVQGWNQRNQPTAVAGTPASPPSTKPAQTSPTSAAAAPVTTGPAAVTPSAPAATPPAPIRWSLFGRKKGKAPVAVESQRVAATRPSTHTRQPPASPAAPIAAPQAGRNIAHVAQPVPVAQPVAPVSGQNQAAVPTAPAREPGRLAAIGDLFERAKDFCVERPLVAGGAATGCLLLAGIAAFFMFSGASKEATDAVPICESFYAEYTNLLKQDAAAAEWGSLRLRVHAKLPPVIAEISALGESRTSAQTESLAAIKSLFELVEPEISAQERQRAEAKFLRHLKAAKAR